MSQSSQINQHPLIVDWGATHEKWICAVATFRLNLSEVARVSGLTRQHVYSVLRGKSVPSMICATEIDRAIDICVDRRRESALKTLSQIKKIKEISDANS